jgi:Protein of unknown function (DUF3593).
MAQNNSIPVSRLIMLVKIILVLQCTQIQHALGFSTRPPPPGAGFTIMTSTKRYQHHRNNRPACIVHDNITRRQPSRCLSFPTALHLQSLPSLHLDITPVEAETLAGPFFGLSLFPYLAFLYFLNVPENETPKGVTVGFAACLVFVFLTIPAAIAAQLMYGVSLADSDWLHGSAESLLTMTNLVTVVAFRQALRGKEREYLWNTNNNNEKNYGSPNNVSNDKSLPSGIVLEEEKSRKKMMPLSATSYQPMSILVGVLTLLAGLTALIPAALWNPEVHTPYLGGFMDISGDWVSFLGHPEPPNALSIAW